MKFEKFDHFQTWANNTQLVETQQVAKREQHVALNNAACHMLHWNVGIVWPGLLTEKRPAKI